MSVFERSFDAPPISRREILRYAGSREGDPALEALLDLVLDEAEGALVYRTCYKRISVTVSGDICDFGDFSLTSRHLARALAGCAEALLLVATVGVGADRLITRYGALSPAKGVLMQAVGAERVEALCDLLCDTLSAEWGVQLRPRFSPGYGDLPLEAQRSLFAALSPEKRIGVFLNDSLLMTPAKSVSAVVGIKA